MRSDGNGFGAARGTTVVRAVRALAACLAVGLALSGCGVARDVFPKAFTGETAPASASPSVRATPAPADAWKTVTTRAGDVSLKIRTDWTMEPVPASEGTSSTGITAYRVLNADGTELATLQQNPGDATSQALPGSTFTPLDSVPAPGVPLLVDSAKARIVFDLTTHPNAESEAVYGLTAGIPVTAKTAPGGAVPLGGGVQGSPKLAGPLLFQGVLALDPNSRRPTQQDAALAAAKQYVFTQEYADLLSMFRSLAYHPDRATGANCDGATFSYKTINIDCDTVLEIYHTARIAELYDERRGATVRVLGDYLCTLKDLGATDLDNQPRGEGIDGVCRRDGGYGSFTARWKTAPG
ncbi:MAG: hypothetical protein ABWX68_04890 [Arthrobacter sp.]|uniref:hypothetical protein n=1 Tax=Arthrobacter sp. TaxID=1667 RepID=UPI0034988B3B